ncbi:cyclic nucleotide-binding domain-containing protein [Mycobacterium sp. Aquia_216]|uniref:cyclic nucleotide-binding domain-containing protein n=1 Tax=Mycobacterium sp. Aquia_216 TaxID=2991729 RepID=UPI00227CE4D2|nr:cyclic nucleotide-binding domain-containing protein [Mycobacterium sp. Aquia_216]WAJ44295.1 cyclic nucleotide-binding domain-containing protein [Mycobacterium sp. Aquia_216]
MPDAGETAPTQLTKAQLARLAAYAIPQTVEIGDVVFRPGDIDYDLIVIEAGWIEIITPTVGDEPEAVVARYGPRGFLGELNFLTGQTAYLTARVVEAGRVYRMSRNRFRELMADDPELSDVLLRTFLVRRDLLRSTAAAKELAIVGSELSAESLALRTFAARQRLPHHWLDIDSPAGQSLIASAQLTPADLPAVITPQQHLARATPGDVADLLGLSYRHKGEDPADLS